MAERAELGDVLRWSGHLHEVVGINDGQRELVLASLDRPPCPTCGSSGNVHVIEGSRLFRENAKPVSTIPGKP